MPQIRLARLNTNEKLKHTTICPVNTKTIASVAAKLKRKSWWWVEHCSSTEQASEELRNIPRFNRGDVAWCGWAHGDPNPLCVAISRRVSLSSTTIWYGFVYSFVSNTLPIIISMVLILIFRTRDVKVGNFMLETCDTSNSVGGIPSPAVSTLISQHLTDNSS